MNEITILLLAGVLSLACVGVYLFGKRRNIDLFKCCGKRGFFVSLILIVFETIILFKRGVDFN
jgi:hypothetical protein